ncbi:MAG TPA: enoyl-CoA hydratase/isomerase family protein [Solirubrobacterales bacterium]|nr:enoyl-CoA hydratase/isomerase family protein [Solirubrobacterales bacterium]
MADGFKRVGGDFAAYGDRYESIAMERRGDVLEVRFHTDGGPLQWGPGQVHDEFEDAFQEIARDSSLRVLIMTGTGEVFSGPIGDAATFPSFPGPRQWEQMRRGATRLLQGLLEIEATIVSCLNGPAMRHAEIPLLGDIVLAAPDACFRDSGHLPNRAVPGDGMHFVMPLLLGFNRARQFLLTGRTIDAEEALRIGVVSEVLPREQLLPRAREIAADLLEQNPLALRYAKLLLMEPVRRRAREELGHGLALEGLGVIDETLARTDEAAG